MRLPTRKEIISRKRTAYIAKIDLLKKGLPHLYGFKYYKWQRNFLECFNKVQFLVAANQIGKSFIQIIKIIHWATATELWPKLWATTPTMFWYIYPDKKTLEKEFKHKWTKILPQGEFKKHPKYGYTVHYSNRKKGIPASIEFNSGVTIYFQFYTQDITNLQAGTVYYIAMDEEPPCSIMPELMNRTGATSVMGYFSMVFTATKGQDYFRRVIELRGQGESKREVFPDAYKQQVSLYDCMKFEDGSTDENTFTKEIIEDRMKNRCGGDPDEIQKRVYGRFVLTSKDKVYYGYSDDNLIEPFDIPSDWLIFSGTDVGTGGKAHKGAVSFIAVRPDFKYGAVVRGWKGDQFTKTTSPDILKKFQEIRDENNFKIEMQTYDWAAGEFRIWCEEAGEPFVPANKNVDYGTRLINSLFANKMLQIFDIPELIPLQEELASIKEKTPKNHRNDDATDSVKYGIADIPWNFSDIELKKEKVKENINILPSPDDREGWENLNATEEENDEIDEFNENCSCSIY